MNVCYQSDIGNVKNTLGVSKESFVVSCYGLMSIQIVPSFGMASVAPGASSGYHNASEGPRNPKEHA